MTEEDDTSPLRPVRELCVCVMAEGERVKSELAKTQGTWQQKPLLSQEKQEN